MELLETTYYNQQYSTNQPTNIIGCMHYQMNIKGPFIKRLPVSAYRVTLPYRMNTTRIKNVTDKSGDTKGVAR